jgi:hypothetical protein
MAIKEVATKQQVHYALENQTIGNAATVTGAVFDTADYDNGIYFAAMITDFTLGTCAMTIYEDDAIGMGTATIVGAANLIYTSPTFGTAATVEGATCAKLGCFGTKRYLRLTFVGDADSNMDIVAVAIKNPEIAPTLQGGL